MARFTGAGGGSGTPGPQGPAGDSAYDVAVENGFVGTEQEWLDSIGGTANIADFVFNYDEEETNSTITIHNHDMIIRTTRDDNEQDADISIRSADDVWITANDEVEITATNSEVRIITGSAEQNTWKFRQDRIIGVDGDTGIESLDNNDVKGRIKFEPNNGRALLQSYGSNNTATFTTGDWNTATWTTVNPGLSLLTLTQTSSILSFMDNTGYSVDVLKISINGGNYGTYTGASSGDGAISFDILGIIPEGEVTVTEVKFQYAFSSKVDIDFDEGELIIRTEDEMSTLIDSDDTLTLRSRNGQTNVQANNSIKFTSNYGEDSQYNWYMRTDGKFELPTEGYIKGLFGNSSDGNNNDTIEVVPDFGLYDNDTNQYLVIEPTEAPSGPGHIHVRAGGTIDQSSADLLLGGERNKVQISDTNRNVGISTRPTQILNTYTNLDTMDSASFAVSSSADIQVGYTVNVGGTDYTVTSIDPFAEGVVVVGAEGAIFDGSGSYTFRFEPTYDNQWTFGSDGVLYGPAMGGLRVSNILNDVNENLSVTAADALLSLNGEDVDISADDDVNITANGAMILEAAGGDMNFYMDGGMYIGPADSNNQIIKRSDLNSVDAKTLPTGGTTGQVLSKIDETDFNATWTDVVSSSTSVLKHTVKLGEAVTKGQAVYVSSADGTNMIVSKASNASEATSSKTIGLVETTGILNDVVNVITEGLLSGLDTSTATAGDPVWLGTGGNLIYGLANKPVAPAHLVFIGVVTRVQQNNGEIFIKVQNGFELKEIHDVLLEANGSIADNEVLAFDSATGLWTNHTATEARLTPLRDGLTSATSAMFPSDLVRAGNTTSGNYWLMGKGNTPYLVYCFYDGSNFWARTSVIPRGSVLNVNGYTTNLGSTDYTLANTALAHLRLNLFGNTDGTDLYTMCRIVGGTFTGAVATTPGRGPRWAIRGAALSTTLNGTAAVSTTTSAYTGSLLRSHGDLFPGGEYTIAVGNTWQTTTNWVWSASSTSGDALWNNGGWLIHTQTSNSRRADEIYMVTSNEQGLGPDNTFTRLEIYVKI